MSNCDRITDKLFNNWYELVQNFDINQAAAEKSFIQIVAAYSSPNRYYHTLEHINHVLEVIQTLESQTQNLETKAVRLAAWFHDIVYDTKAKDNEEKSAEYGVSVLSSLSIPSDAIKNVKNLILATKNHQALNSDRNAQVLLDADLSILGSNPDEYSKYTHAIRQEYIWVAEVEYFAARKQILQSFLQRENIYFTQIMQQTKEKIARNNIKAEIERLNYS
ncbi:HD domain-containing protein [Rivularia sp. UHCC 0363]|uniref:HD domain-containing protein n=1 Tax=Rivularia sp. UHCC 0363 TaxID=3110244 RepID=UPI002B21E09B|nr:HD domain-containing protein [Rivularia sp. UHCC 0363]MEA5599382.1 HD domain-containing protein [Rivularia sp. UHCC 0363]